MKNIGIFSKIHDPRCKQVAGDLVEWINSKGLSPLVEDQLAQCLELKQSVDRFEIAKSSDLVVVLGGDGTLISVARLLVGRDVPIVGVNLGSLGFLTEITISEMVSVLDNCLHGDYRVSERMMLQATIFRNEDKIAAYDVLNDVVINKGALARIIELDTLIDGNRLTKFRADGLIVSSPTGSTGYSLAAQGPVVHPSLDCFVITPICPHTLTNRPIVVSGNTLLCVTLKSKEEDVFLTLDGQIKVELKSGDVICIEKSTHRTKLVLSGSKDYFEVLRTKLKWNES